MATAARAGVGHTGEGVAADYLEGLGYRIRARNFRCELGEIDLVATKGEYVVFVEVKTRSQRTPYHPTLAVTGAKRERLRRLGEHYLAHELAGEDEGPWQPRFDVVSVVLQPGWAAPRGTDDRHFCSVEHFVNAF